MSFRLFKNLNNVAVLNQIFYYALFTWGSVILVSVLPFFDRLNLFKKLVSQ